jgi:hypothetical protein
MHSFYGNDTITQGFSSTYRVRIPFQAQGYFGGDGQRASGEERQYATLNQLNLLQLLRWRDVIAP